MTMVEMACDGSVVRLTMNAPDRLNALSDEMLAALQARLDEIAHRPDIRVVILAGAGKAFCAGHDLREMEADPSPETIGALFDQCSRIMVSLTRLPQPVIARVHGIATAAGCQLVASCDLAVAAEGTRFGVNGVNIGLFCSTPMVALTRNIPRKKAFEMLTTGQFIEADEAETLGLVNRVVPAEALEAEARALAEQVAEKLGTAVRIGKQAFYAQAEMGLDAAYAYTGQVMVENMLDRDTTEGISAFLDKRPASWRQ